MEQDRHLALDYATEDMMGRAAEVTIMLTTLATNQRMRTLPMAQALFVTLSTILRYLQEDFCDGPYLLKLAPGIRFHNFGPFLYLPLLLLWLNGYSSALWIYLALHSGDCVYWLARRR